MYILLMDLRVPVKALKQKNSLLNTKFRISLLVICSVQLLSKAQN